MKSLKGILLFFFFILISANDAHADVIWPALYVADSHFRFWYIVIIGLIFEAVVLKYYLSLTFLKSILISFVANAISSTFGIYLLVFGMMGWHFALDDLLHDSTFDPINKIATIAIMFSGSVFIEAIVTRLIWKYKIKTTVFIFVIGNIISYGLIIFDLYLCGVWNKSL